MVQKRTILSWDDLAAALAVAEAGSVRAAAERLGVAHTTLARRIEAAEIALGAVLFVRGVGGHAPTEAGRVVIERAARMAEAADSLRREVVGSDQTPRGRVRITMPPSVLAHSIAPALPRFAAAFPGIQLDIDTGYGFSDLDRQDADVAVRLQNGPLPMLVGTRVGASHEALYVAADARAEGAPGGLPIIGWARDETVLRRALALGLDDPQIGIVCPDVAGQLALAEAGLGVAILPCIVGGSSPRLVRLDAKTTVAAQDIWVLTHVDMRRSQRVKAVSEFLAEALRADQNRFAGRTIADAR